MLKNINWKGILMAFTWLVSLSGLVVLMSFIEVKKASQKCKDLKVILPGRNNFIERNEIDRILLDAGGALIGRDLRDINIHKLENSLKSNPFIEFAKVYVDMDGVIHAEVRQRQPILRLINRANVQFYIDENGLKMPLSENFTANVLVANGLIDEDFSGKVDTLNTKLAKDLFRMAQFIKADTLWDSQIEQLYVDVKGDIEMVPRVGNHKIILGDADSLQSKFKNLLAFYKKAMPKVGWDTYKSINLKFANQVVCSKNSLNTSKLVVDSIPNTVDSTMVINKELTKN
ncbi:cell division protein FtsQ [Daejeonella sp.]|uniref:cell division protein FtsQ/DivIB n=1 Tax=Daejeonella sp. TaxID=2805397 RepID=UPI0025BE1BC9|nr:cell division protein FtsQ [Daejeonella sp.]